MMELFNNNFFCKSTFIKAWRPLITHAKRVADSVGLSTASPSAPAPSRFGLSVAIPGRYRSFITIIFLIAVSACSNNDKPDGVLSKDEMAKVLTEFYLKESKINSLHVSQDSGTVLMDYFRTKYSAESGIPDSVVVLSYEYYISKPLELGEIYDRVIDTLSLREQKASSLPVGRKIE